MKYLNLILYISGFITAMATRVMIRSLADDSFIISEIGVFTLLILLIVISNLTFGKYFEKFFYRSIYRKGYRTGYRAGSEQKTVYKLVIPITDKGGCDEKRIYEALETKTE